MLIGRVLDYFFSVFVFCFVFFNIYKEMVDFFILLLVSREGLVFFFCFGYRKYIFLRLVFILGGEISRYLVADFIGI